MRNLIPNSDAFASILLQGPDAKDFAQRLFTRDYRSLQEGEGRLSLFLSSDGKIQSLFWSFLEKDSVLLIVQEKLQKALFDLVEHYHFSDRFETIMGTGIRAEWSSGVPPSEISNSAIGSGKKIGKEYWGYWRGTHFIFNKADNDDEKANLENSTKSWSLDWESHCQVNNICLPAETYIHQLVFKAGLEELCDFGKGCYIGQEIVERVRTRDQRKKD